MTNNRSDIDKFDIKLPRALRFASKIRVVSVLVMGLSLSGGYLYLQQEEENFNNKKSKSILSEDNNCNLEFDSVCSIVDSYMLARKMHDQEKTFLLHADTLIRYFRVINLAKGEVKKLEFAYWKRYTEDKFISEASPLISKTDFGYLALIKGKQCRESNRCRSEILEIHLNTVYEISFVRAYYDTEKLDLVDNKER